MELLLAGVVYLADLGLYFVEPILDRVQLGRVGWQIEDVHANLAAQIDGLLFIVNGAIVQHQPLFSLILFGCAFLLSQLLLFLLHPPEQLLDEIQVFIFTICAFDDAPVSQSVICDYGYQGKTFSLGDRAIDSDLFIGSSPCFITGHVQVKAALVQEVDFGIFLDNLHVPGAVIMPFLQ